MAGILCSDPNQRRKSRSFLLGGVLLGLLVAGCARYPETAVSPNAPTSTLVSEITVDGVINPNYYYFFALDTDGDTADGPIPIADDLHVGWGTISGIGPNDPVIVPPFYVVYHNGQFQQYRNDIPIGPPFRGEVTTGGTRLYVEIDLEEIVPPGTPLPASLEANWITMTEIVTQPTPAFTREYDGFGVSGNRFFEITGLNTDNIWISGVGTTIEELPNDSTDVADIDMIGWRIELKIGSGNG